MPTQTILIVVVLAVLLLFMFRNGRKRQRDQATLTSTLKPGAEIMTSGGIFGTIESIDEEENRIVLKTGPTSQLTIHRQAVGRVVTPVADDQDANSSHDVHVGSSTGTAQLNGEPIVTESSTLGSSTTAPEYGERTVGDHTVGERGAEATPTPEQAEPAAAPRRRPARASKRSSGE
ncbi:preprotein translocase subunit YajC [uncultured Amnibacterium sp.]|uniref:preprotein translocase subunit YajC n=1 Tax=uncultured Amnibacterium sp. TaxID=1631851 RepID=UPI0035CC1F9A